MSDLQQGAGGPPGGSDLHRKGRALGTRSPSYENRPPHRGKYTPYQAVESSSTPQAHRPEPAPHSESLKIRCPHCFQIFKAFQSEFEEPYPDFCCSVCQGEFWVDPLSARVGEVAQGVSVSVPKVQTHPPAWLNRQVYKMCPKCLHKCKVSDTECIYCGVVFKKWVQNHPVRLQLRSLWESVLKQWQNEKAHNDFLTACHNQNRLLYGMSCYGRILKEDRKNRKAKEILTRMKALSFPHEPPLRFKEDMFYLTRRWFQRMSNRFDFRELAVRAFLLGLVGVVFAYLIF